MIVIYAPYPFPDLVRGGWMRRIATVERIFADRQRTYVYPGDPLWAADPCDYRVHFADVAPGAAFAWLDFRFSNHVRKLTELVDAADFVYAHTSHSCQHLLPYYRTGKVITDLHGIAPEEEQLLGNPGRAAFFGALEEDMIRGSAALVTVTEAMAAHFRTKYPGLDTPTILMPIVDDVAADAPIGRAARARPIVVYAGGVQDWQNVDQMMQAVAHCRATFDFQFYTDAVPAMTAAAERHGVSEAVRIRTAAPEQLPAIYGEADLGFVLRDDIAVNRVSCPTKLSEYLAFGVVPIVALAAIGDFARLGYRYVTVADFAAGRVPDAAQMTAMRRQNRAVFDTLRRSHATGVQRLRALAAPAPRVSVARRPSLFLTSVEREAFFPLRGAYLEVERASGRHRIVLGDEVGPVVRRRVELPGAGELRAVHLRLAYPPFVTTPLRVEVRDAAGTATVLVPKGGFRVDAYGNWVFDGRDGSTRADGQSIAQPRELSLQFEFILVGPEAYVAGARPQRPRWSFARRLVAALRRDRGNVR